MVLTSVYARIQSSLLVRNAAWLFAGQGLSLVAQGIYFVVLARVLGTEQYGLLAGVVALAAVAGQYSSMGAGIVFLRYVSADHNQFGVYWGNVLMSILLLGGALAGCVCVAGHHLLGPASAALLIPIALGECLFSQLSGCAGQVFQAFEKMKLSAGLTLMSNMARCALAGGMYLFMGRATAAQWALASFAVSAATAALAFAFVTWQCGWPVFAPSLLARRFAEGIVFAVSGSTTVVYNDVDKVVLAHLGMIRANGIYSMAYRMINIGAIPIASLAGAALPRFFREGVRGVAATLPMARALLLRVMVPGALISAGLFVAAPLIPLFVGKSYQESVSALRWLCLIPLFRCFHLTAGDALAGAGEQKFRLASQTIAAAGNLLLNLLLIPRYSWEGAAWASLMTDGALGVMNWSVLLVRGRSHTAVLQGARL